MKYFSLILVSVLFISCDSKKLPPQLIIATIYLTNFDSVHFKTDVKYLREFDYVTDVVFVSKEEAKKKYLGEGNDDWSKVLDENPLPDSYNVVIDGSKFPDSGYKSFKQKVLENIRNSTDVHMPTILHK